MQDTIVEEILRAPSMREHTRTHVRIETIVPPANRYPHKQKRAELERRRQPWSNNSTKTANGYSSARFV